MAGWKFYLNATEVEEPIGWDGVEFTAKRMESHGMDQPFSTELTFYELGARLIKAVYDAEFINGNITLLIESDVITNGVAWSYLGYIDLSMYSEKNVCDTDSWEITVGILEDNFREKFKARMDVEVDLLTMKDLDQNTIPAVTLHETRLHCQELFLQGDASQYDDKTLNFGIPFEPIFPVYFRNSDFNGLFGNTFDPIGSYFTPTNVIFQNNADSTRTLSFSGRSVFSMTNNHPVNSYGGVVFISLLNAGGTLDTTYTLFTIPLIPHNQTRNYDFTWSQDITIPVGYRISYGVSMEANISGYTMTFFKENTLRITELNSTAYASTAKGLLIKDYLQRIVYILTGQSNSIISDYFEPNSGCEWANLLTTGLYIRNGQLIDQSNPSIKTSFKKTFEDLSKIFCLGWQYEQQPDLSWKIRIEPVDYFYQMNLMASFENAGDIRQYALTDDLVNNIIVGYSDIWKNIAVSGIFEIHTERNYFVKNKAMSRGSTSKLDLRSDIIASGYAIEFSRRLQFLVDDSGSSDRPNDYETFIIALNSGEITFDVTNSGYQLPDETGEITFAPASVSYGSNFIAVSNGPIGRIYNIPLTPMRNAIRWWKMLGMHTYGLAATDAKLFFQVGEYFTTYSSEIISSCLEEIQGEVLAENMDISKDVLQPAFQDYIFKPIGLEFEYPQDLCGFITMGDPGNGCVSVTSGSFNGLGFIQSSSNKPEDNSGGTTKFTLILANKTLPTGRPYSDGYSDGFE